MSDITILVDGASVYVDLQTFAEENNLNSRLKLNYEALVRLYPDAEIISFITIAPGDMKGEDYVNVIKSFGVKVDATDYRISRSVVHRIAYTMGILDDNMMIISSATELVPLIKDRSERIPDRETSLAYFASLMDWSIAKSSRQSKIKFIDLDPRAKDLLNFSFDLGAGHGRELPF